MCVRDTVVWCEAYVINCGQLICSVRWGFKLSPRTEKRPLIPWLGVVLLYASKPRQLMNDSHFSCRYSWYNEWDRSVYHSNDSRRKMFSCQTLKYTWLVYRQHFTCVTHTRARGCVIYIFFLYHEICYLYFVLYFTF